jgi:hypothetical protein
MQLFYQPEKILIEASEMRTNLSPIFPKCAGTCKIPMLAILLHIKTCINIK